MTGVLVRQVRPPQVAGRGGPEGGRHRGATSPAHLDEPARHGRGETATGDVNSSHSAPTLDLFLIIVVILVVIDIHISIIVILAL